MDHSSLPRASLRHAGENHPIVRAFANICRRRLDAMKPEYFERDDVLRNLQDLWAVLNEAHRKRLPLFLASDLPNVADN